MDLNRPERPILYVEDDENDVFFVSRAFGKAAGPRVAVVVTGKDAVDYLAQAERGEQLEPCLVLLDLNLPFLNGHEVLHWIRGQPRYATIPVIVFTSSAQSTDIERAYAAGATAYLVKPNAPARMTEVAAALVRVVASPADARQILETSPVFQPAEVSKVKAEH